MLFKFVYFLRTSLLGRYFLNTCYIDHVVIIMWPLSINFVVNSDIHLAYTILFPQSHTFRKANECYFMGDKSTELMIYWHIQSCCLWMNQCFWMNWLSERFHWLILSFVATFWHNYSLHSLPRITHNTNISKIICIENI